METITIGASIGISKISQLIRCYQKGFLFTHVFYVFDNIYDISNNTTINDLHSIEAWHLPILKLGKVYHNNKEYNYKLHKDNTIFTLMSIEVTKKQKNKIEEFLLNQVNKKYDYLSIINFIIKKDFTQKNSWFCSELIAASFQYAGLNLWKKQSYKITIKDLLIAIKDNLNIVSIKNNIFI